MATLLQPDELPTSVMVLLVGIPAAGKSSLAEEIMKSSSATAVGPGSESSAEAVMSAHEIAGLASATVHVVSYDDLFDELATADGNEQSALNFDPELWHASRREALGRAAALLRRPSQAAKTSKDGRTPPAPPNSSEEVPEKQTAVSRPSHGHGHPPRRHLTVVVLDDTFHFRSMRREARRVARGCGAGLVVAHVDARLDVCLRRNAARLPVSRRVPEASLRRIHASLEPPGGKGWASSSSSSSSSGSSVAGSGGGEEPDPGDERDDVCDGAHDAAGDPAGDAKAGGASDVPPVVREEGAEVVLLPSPDSQSTVPQNALDRLWRAVARAKALLPEAGESRVDAAALAAARAQTEKSVVHAADLALRKMLKYAMSSVRTVKATASPHSPAETEAPERPSETKNAPMSSCIEIDARRLAQIFNDERRLFLGEFQEGSVAPKVSEENLEKEEGAARHCDFSWMLNPFLRRLICELKRVEITEGCRTGKQRHALQDEICRKL